MAHQKVNKGTALSPKLSFGNYFSHNSSVCYRDISILIPGVQVRRTFAAIYIVVERNTVIAVSPVRGSWTPTFRRLAIKSYKILGVERTEEAVCGTQQISLHSRSICITTVFQLFLRSLGTRSLFCIIGRKIKEKLNRSLQVSGGNKPYLFTEEKNNWTKDQGDNNTPRRDWERSNRNYSTYSVYIYSVLLCTE